jgi:hypothetical protein
MGGNPLRSSIAVILGLILLGIVMVVMIFGFRVFFTTHDYEYQMNECIGEKVEPIKKERRPTHDEFENIVQGCELKYLEKKNEHR